MSSYNLNSLMKEDTCLYNNSLGNAIIPYIINKDYDSIFDTIVGLVKRIEDPDEKKRMMRRSIALMSIYIDLLTIDSQESEDILDILTNWNNLCNQISQI